jgi:antitoxin CcdA
LDKRPVSLTADAALLDEARALNISLSAVFEAGLRDAVRERRAARWREENRAALEDYNAWVAENGLPLGKYRQF